MLSLEVKNAEGKTLEKSESAQNSDYVNLVYAAEYTEGDRIAFSADVNAFYVIQLDPVFAPSFIYLKKSPYELAVPFNEKRFSYNPKTFSGDLHLLKARRATPQEIGCYKNLALNEHDTPQNISCFPHASANIETRGESIFAARNAINGNTENHSHGKYPYESWGINRDPTAELTLDFGRLIIADKITFVLRADFPHDNYWTQIEARFSDGSSHLFYTAKTAQKQEFPLENKKITSLTLCNLVKNETDPSPFPALTQLEVYGTEA